MSSVFPDPNLLDVPRIAAAPFVGGVEYRPAVESTQNLATELLRRRVRDLPLLVLAGEQTAGRGRGQNPWWSARGALTFSLAIDSQLEANANLPDPRRALVAGLAICEVVRPLAAGFACGLKWPNDVYLAGRKLCGVLVEAFRGDGPLRDRTVFGIGLNVNNSLSLAPPEIAGTATSLFDTTGRHHDLTDLLLAILERLQHELAALAQADPDQVERWQEASLLDGRQVLVAQGSLQIAGRCRGLDSRGALIVDTTAGRRHVIAGEVRRFEPPLG
jgi:BirA family biotin operon repressor/biotin-[acetyl-CoA-carboxylase] ligase